MTLHELRRIFWMGTAAILIAAALVALGTVLYGDFSDTEFQILGSLGALFLAGGAFVSSLALIDRDGALLGRLGLILTPVGFVSTVYAIWNVFGEGDEWRYGWSGILLLVATLVSVTARLLAHSPGSQALAWMTGVLGGLAAALSLYAVWNHESDGIAQALAALWILTGLCYLLVPVVQRFGAASPGAPDGRVLTRLGDVELVATHSSPGLDVRLEPGERLVLRRRA